MARYLLAVAAVALAAWPAPLKAQDATPSDYQIRQAIISLSIADYPGSCPCPYNVDRAGRRCGARSAYSRPGGYEPLCYASDVTAPMIAAFRATQPR